MPFRFRDERMEERHGRTAGRQDEEGVAYFNIGLPKDAS
jgi:hypothetical protein